MTWFRVGGAGIPASLKTAMNSVLNKKFGTSGQNYPPKGWPDDVNLLGPLPEKTVSGAIVNFSDGADTVPLKELIFSASPVQASGTPSPSNPLPISGHTSLTGVHCGKNLFDISSLNVSPVSVSDGVATGTGNNFYTTFRNGIPNIIVPQTQFTISAKAYTTGTSGTTGNGLFIRIFYTDGTNDTVYFLNSDSSYTTRSLTSNANKTASAIGISCSTNGGNTWWLKEVQIEVGNQATTYAPYSAESKKWEFPPFGKNLFDKDAVENDKYLDTTTGLPVTAINYVVSDYIAVKKNVSVYIPNTWTARRWFYDVNKTPTTYLNTSSAQVYTPPEDGYIRVSILKTQVDLDTFQIELNGATAYEPYQSMFSGQVNALDGTAENGSVLEAFTEIVTNGVQSQFDFISTTSSMDFLTTCVRIACELRSGVDTSIFNKVSNTYPAYLQRCNMLPHYFGYNSDTEHWYRNNVLYIFLPISECGNTKESVVAYLQGLVQQGKALSLLLPYASGSEPSIDMDSVDWQSKYADNNFYNDCGDTSVTYRQDIALALQALQGSRSLSASLMRSASPEEVSEPEENIQNTEETEGESDER